MSNIRTKSATVIGKKPPTIADALVAIREQHAREEAEARLKREEAEAAIARLARGTRDVPASKLPTIPLMPAHPPARRSPYWVGDDGPTDELKAAILRCIQGNPNGTTFQEILQATGARGNRVSGAIVKLQRDGHRIKNLGDQRVARWWAPTSGRRSTR